MAVKRMFDRSIIETDNFLNVSQTAKGFYFLLGMEADDEGFVSPTRVMRLYGFELGDLKNLIDVNLVIPFNSGVVVITDWHQNNWLDKRRIKPTQYQEERAGLEKTEQGKYLLSDGLAVAEPEERRGEERSIEEKSTEEVSVEEKTPAQEAREFFSVVFGKNPELNKTFIDIFDEFKENIPENLEDQLKIQFQKFVNYWIEKTKSGKKQKWETEKTFEVKRRLVYWLSRANEFNKIDNQSIAIII